MILCFSCKICYQLEIIAPFQEFPSKTKTKTFRLAKVTRKEIAVIHPQIRQHTKEEFQNVSFLGREYICISYIYIYFIYTYTYISICISYRDTQELLFINNTFARFKPFHHYQSLSPTFPGVNLHESPKSIIFKKFFSIGSSHFSTHSKDLNFRVFSA